MTVKKIKSKKNEAAVSLGRKGGHASLKKQGIKKIRENGRKGALVRWNKK